MTVSFAKIPIAKSVSHFRANLARELSRARKSPVVIGDRRGGETFVVLSAEAYNKLVEAREDARDARTLVCLVREAKGKKRVAWKRR